MRLLTVCAFLFQTFFLFAQNKNATISGRIIDENENGISNVSVLILGKTKGVPAKEDGSFTISVPSAKTFALVFSHTSYISVQKNFFLSPGENETITIKLLKSGKLLDEVTVKDERQRTEAGLIKINPRNALTLPSTTGGVEALIKTLVGSNNELTSQYNVRGGSYDENLVYINDFEVYRPYLVSSGQQEGLSLINPSLARNVSFYTGGFQAKYGDKMSSVLDIQYKKPAKFAGSVYVSLLEQGAYTEGSSANKKFSYLAGVRNKSNQSLLSNQPTQGAYIPSASDAQALVTYKFTERWQAEVLGIFSSSRFTFYPESVQKTASVFSPFYTSNIGLDVFFEGQEKDKYTSSLLGISIIQNPNKAIKLKWMASRFKDDENENFDIAGAIFLAKEILIKPATLSGKLLTH